MAPDKPAEYPIRALMDSTGIPWRLPRSELAARYRVRPHPAYGWDVIEIETPRSFFPDLLWPLSVQVFPNFSTQMPATEFSSRVYVDADARTNLSVAEKRLTDFLGQGNSRNSSSNTLARYWKFGAALAELIVWPPDLQQWPMSNPAHELEPRLKTACYIAINSGYRIPCSAHELAMFRTFKPISSIAAKESTRVNVRDCPAHQSELEFVREPHSEAMNLFGLLGLSADRATLIFFNSQLYLVPMRDVIGFRVARVRPAKGPGGSQLHVECRTSYEAIATKSLLITSADGIEDLNGVAAKVSGATGKPFKLDDYEDDA